MTEMVKKEKYFEKKNISQQAEGFIDSLKKFGRKEFTGLDTDHATLIVLDMQGDFLNESSHAYIPSAPAIVPNILNLQQVFLNNELPVVQTRHLNTPEDAGRMMAWWKRLMSPDDPLNRIHAVLEDNRANVMNKHQYDAFYQTGLRVWLARRKIKQVVITGVMAHLCCETTARSAFVRGFDVFFVVDGTATYNREFHLASLLNLSHGFAVPVLARDVIGCFQLLNGNKT
jgi:bifunctional isochorismate lyase/aryl carrier protein